jgi:hypothetical protein
MSDLNFNIIDANKPSDKQMSDLSFASQSLQIDAKEMQAIAGKSTDAITAAGFASAEQLLAGFSETEQLPSDKPAPADITGKIAFVAQYQLQLEGVNKIGVEARNENGKGYLLIKDGNTHMQEKFDRVTGQHLGFTSMEIPM